MASSQTFRFKETLPGLGRIVRRFSPYVRKQRHMVAGSMAALFFEVIFRLLEPWPLKFVFDHVIVAAPSDNPSGIAFLDGLDSMTLLMLCALAVVAFTGLRAIAAYLSTVGFILIGNRVLTKVRDEVFRHLQSLSLSFHNKSRGGDLTVRVISDIGMLRDITVTAFMPLIANVFIMLGMLGVMFWLHWKLALLSLAIVPLFWFSVTRLGRRIQEVSRKQRKQEGEMAATAAESIGAIKIVKALSLEGTFARIFAGQNKKSLKKGIEGSRLAAGMERTVDLLIAVATALVLWYGARLVVVQNELSPGELLVFLSYLKNTFKPVRDFAKYTGRLAKATAAGERVLDLLDQSPKIYDLPGAVKAHPFRGGVEFKDVSFAYESESPVLKTISFDIRPGQHVALTGLSGSGKSTLVSLILRLYDPTKGAVMIDGRDIREYTLDSLRSQISVVLQDSILFAASVRDNISYGAPDAAPEEIEKAARLANAHDFINALPQGYDTVLGERGVTLSGGQRQRIAIARAAIRKSPILILDEPATGLDNENENTVIEALEELASGCTTFLITHDLQLASRFADLILYLENGDITERGAHSELMRAGGRYSALYKLQSAARDLNVNEEEPYAVAR